MDCTNCGNECPFVKQGFCQKDSECPHYMESWWVEADSGNQKLVKDCAPKRLMLDSQNQYNRSISMQASIDKMEHRLAKLEAILQALIHQSQAFIAEQKLLLEQKTGGQS